MKDWPLFYAPDVKEQLALPEAEAQHALRVLVTWSSSSGGALLALCAVLVDVVDAAQYAARRTRYSWPLVSPREVTALPRSAEGHPSAL